MCMACNEGLLTFARGALNRRTILSGAGAFVAVAAHGSARPSPADPADVIFTGGTILTQAPASPRVEAVAVRAGRILRVGSRDDVFAARGPGTQVVDLAGRTLVPGLIDPHMHATFVYFDDWVDVGPQTVRDMDGVKSALRAAVAQARPGEWVRACQFDPSITRGAEPLTLALLDRIAPDTPMLILENNGHVGYANSRALAVVGVTRDTPDPPQARYVRDANGALTGRIEEGAAFAPFVAALPQPSPQEMARRTTKLLHHAASKGCTALFDAGIGALSGEADLALLQTVTGGDSPVRYGGALVSTHMDLWEKKGLRPGAGTDRLRLTAIKAWSDGSNQARTGYQREPYIKTGGRGALNYTPAELAAVVKRAHDAGWPVWVHANGDAAIDVTLDAYEAALKSGTGDRRHRIEHCSVLHPEQIARMKALGVSPSFLIGHVYFWGRAFRDDILGPERAKLYDPCATALRAGLRISLHSDYNVTPIDPLRCMENATTRIMQDGGEVLTPSERISAEAALRAVTADAAWQSGADHITGSITAGKYADFALLEDDPTRVPATSIGKIKVSETWMDGVKRFG